MKRALTHLAALPLMLFLGGSSSAAFAGTTGTLTEHATGTKFPVTRSVEGQSYHCLGTGLRKVFFFKVYANTFCLAADQADSLLAAAVKANGQGKTGEDLADLLEDNKGFFKALYANKADKLVVMHMVRNVSKEKLAGAFEESLGKILPKASIKTLMGAVNTDAKDGMDVLFSTHGDSVTIQIGSSKKTFTDPAVAAKIWRVWIGPESVTENLMEDIAARAAR